MKIPAAAIVAAFAGGILLGRWPFFAAKSSTPAFLLALFLCCCVSLLLGFRFALRDRCLPGGVSSLFSWVLLGAFSSAISQQPLSANHAATRIAKGELNLASPLRWYGHLSSEPVQLPWGYSVDVAL